MTLYRHHQRLAERYAAEGQRRLWQLNQLQLERAKECLLLQIVIAFTSDDSQTKNSVNRKDEIVRQFFTCLRQSYRKEHEVGYYADKQCLSMRYFSFVVRERNARQMIVETDKTVKEISELLCFPSQSYFGKWFKVHTGMGPTEYKRSVNSAKKE